MKKRIVYAIIKCRPIEREPGCGRIAYIIIKRIKQAKETFSEQ